MDMETVAKSHPVEQRSNQKFGLRVLCPDLGHVPAPLFARYAIGHGPMMLFPRDSMEVFSLHGSFSRDVLISVFALSLRSEEPRAVEQRFLPADIVQSEVRGRHSCRERSGAGLLREP